MMKSELFMSCEQDPVSLYPAANPNILEVRSEIRFTGANMREWDWMICMRDDRGKHLFMHDSFSVMYSKLLQ